MALPLSRATKAGVVIKIGMLALPVSVHSSVADEEDLKTVCAHTGTGKTEEALSTIRQSRACPVCEATEGFGKAAPVGDGFIEVPAEVLEAAAAAEDIGDLELGIHPASEVVKHTLATGRTYYLSTKVAHQAYATFARVVADRDDLALVAMLNIRGAAHPYRLVAEDGTLLLRQLADPALVRERPQIEGDVLDANVASLNRIFEDNLSTFDPASLARPKNRIITEYLEGKAPVPAAQVDSSGGATVIDFTAQLAASLPKTAAKKAATKAPAAPAKKATPRKRVPAARAGA